MGSEKRAREKHLAGNIRVAGLVALIAFTLQNITLSAEPNADNLPPVLAEHHAHVRSLQTAKFIQHIDRDESGKLPPEPVVASTAADVLEALDRATVRHALLVSVAYRLGQPGTAVDDERARVRAENEYVAAQVANAPERLAGACSVNPLKDYAFDEIRACAKDQRISVMKLHFTNSDVDLKNPDHVNRLIDVFRLLDSRGLSVLVHMRTRSDDYGAGEAGIFIRSVLAETPGLHVQIAHVTGWGGYDDATDSALGAFASAFAESTIRKEDVSFDLAAVVFDPDVAGENLALANQVRAANEKLARRIREIGVDRFLFATDWPSWPPTTDARLKVARNVQLLHKALPLSTAEWAQIHSNMSPVFRDTNR